MRRVAFFCLLPVFLFLPLLPLHAEEAPARVLRQDISVSLDPPRHLLRGETSIAFAPGTATVRLRLAPSAQVDSVAAAGEKIPFSFVSGILTLHLPQRGQTVAISYRAGFNDQVSSSPAAGEAPSYGVNAAIGSEGTFLGGGAYWYPVPEQVPEHRTVTVAAPAGIEAIGFGARLSRETAGAQTRSVWREEHPVGLLSLCAGRYLVEERKAAGVTLYSYFYKDNAALAPRYLDAAAQYLALYQELFGPYPFEKFAVVENYFPTGYGFPSFTLLGGTVIRLPFIVDTSLPHEIAHSWWGNGVGVDLSEGNWCEGLVTYLADYLLKERRSAAEALEYRRQLLVDYASLVTPQNDFPLSSFVGRVDPASRAIGYGKAAMVFHMIRMRIGDQAFFEGLKRFARQRMYRDGSWSDLLAAFSAASGADLSGFKAWIVRTGGPRLALSGVELRRAGNGWQVKGRVTQSPPYFALDLPLRVDSAAAGTTAQLHLLPAAQTPFSLDVPSPPDRLLLDPAADVFRILAPGEIPATVNSVKGSTRLLGVRTGDCRAAPETFRAFLDSLSQDRAEIVDETALSPAIAAGRDLVLCGVPQKGSLLPPGGELPGPAALPDSLLFQVLKRPPPEEGVVALFLPGSEPAAQRYAPKVTHYGKYGSLFFAGGVNRRKATAVPADPAVAVTFTSAVPGE